MVTGNVVIFFFVGRKPQTTYSLCWRNPPAMGNLFQRCSRLCRQNWGEIPYEEMMLHYPASFFGTT
jgi:hypothetical protein